jgi:hypothetical protein
MTATVVKTWPVLVAVLTATAIVAGCGDNTTTDTSPTPTPKGPESWSSVLAPGGSSSRSFTVTAAGTIAVTLSDAGGRVIGLGVGLPRTTGGGCRLGMAVNTGAGSSPQLTTQAEAGQYCVQVFDLGTLTDPIPFAMMIEHP